MKLEEDKKKTLNRPSRNKMNLKSRSNPTSEKPISTACRETPASWKNGFEKVSKTGRRT